MRCTGTQLFSKLALSVLAYLACGTALTFAQQPAVTGGIDPRLTAFDGDVVGYDGMVVDMKIVSVAYDEIDYQIADLKKQIEEAEALIDLRQRSGGARSASAIQVLTHDIAIAQARIHELELKRAMREAGSECDSTLKLWRELAEFLTTDIAAEQGYVQEAPPGSDARVDFQNVVDRDKSQLAVAYSQIEKIAELCKLTESTKAIERINVALGSLNEQAETSGAEAIAIARHGHFKDLPAISQKLPVVLAAARLNQLMGNEEIGLHQQQLAFQSLHEFVMSASTACMNESFDILSALAVQRQWELVDGEGENPLSPCLYRLREAGGGHYLGPYYLAIRTCTDGVSAANWEIRWTPRFASLTGSEDSTSQKGGSGTLQFEADGTGTAKVSGLVTSPDKRTLPYVITMDGPATLKSVEFKAKTGIVTRIATTMSIDWTIEEHRITSYGHTLTMPAKQWPHFGGEVAILNDNKPCDPGKNVWDYP